MIIRKANKEDILQVVELTKEWEKENITYGFVADTYEELLDYTCFVAVKEEKVIGFIFGKIYNSKNMGSIMPEGTPYFEVEEVYVKAGYRSLGFGSKLFLHLEEYLKSQAVYRIVLSTATKDYEKALHFYVNKLNMNVWSIRFFKNLDDKKEE
ncbi:MAG: GNAT family N-acetyltransferase [Bacilli bacterium]